MVFKSFLNLFKVFKSPLTMNKMLQTNDCLNDLRNPRILASKRKSTIKYGIDTIAFKIPQI